MTKSRAIERTAAELDSHRETMRIHRDASVNAMFEKDWHSVITAAKLALMHANVIHDKQAKSELFGRMNIARHNLRKAVVKVGAAMSDIPADLSNTDA